METRYLGSSGLKASALGFGAGAIGGLMVRGERRDQEAAVRRAMEAGIAYFDTAPDYGDGRSEEHLGRTLTALRAWGKVTVGTKVRLRGADLAEPAAAVRRSLAASLARMGAERVDLLQVHNRIGEDDGAVSLPVLLGSVADVLDQLVREGSIAAAGITGMGETSAVYAAVLSGRFKTVQTYVNALNPSAGAAGASGGGQDFDGLIGAAAGSGVGVIGIRPYAGGALAGAVDRHRLAGDPGPLAMAGSVYGADVQRATRLTALATEHGLESALELSLRLVVGLAGVSTVLVGYSDLDQLEAAIRWTEKGALPSDIVALVIDAARAARATAQ